MLKLESILRTEETKLYKTLSLTGKVLDLGGVKNSEYLKLAQGDFVVTSVNFDASTGCDVLHNLEQTPIPFPDSSYDAVVLNNTLEHIYHVQELVKESVRVLKKGGRIIITIPFLFPEHPSPSDYWRFTEESIRKMLEDNSMSEIYIQSLGTGVFTVCFHFVERLLPKSLRVLTYVLRPVVYMLDSIMYAVRKKGSKQKRKYYALGYFIVGTK